MRARNNIYFKLINFKIMYTLNKPFLIYKILDFLISYKKIKRMKEIKGLYQDV